MSEEPEVLHGYDRIIVHDFVSECYCGACGAKMSLEKQRYTCPKCHMTYQLAKQLW